MHHTDYEQQLELDYESMLVLHMSLCLNFEYWNKN